MNQRVSTSELGKLVVQRNKERRAAIKLILADRTKSTEIARALLRKDGRSGNILELLESERLKDK